MAIYAVGDVQGCYSVLRALLDKCAFDPAVDRFWLLGDVVNRGSESLQVLRFVREADEAGYGRMVLGNHDLHLLAHGYGFAPLHRQDTLLDIMTAPDRDDLLTWLRQQPLFYREKGYAMTHAGLWPTWSWDNAALYSHEVSHLLQSDDTFRDVLSTMYGNSPAFWADHLRGVVRLRAIINIFTRMRMLVAAPEASPAHDWVLDWHYKNTPENALSHLCPWYDCPALVEPEGVLLHGHWSALGVRQHARGWALDSGYLWGGALTALRLEDNAIFQVKASGRLPRR